MDCSAYATGVTVTPFQSVKVRLSRRVLTSWVPESMNRVALAANARNERARTGFKSKSWALPSRRNVSLNRLPVPPEGFTGLNCWDAPTAFGLRYSCFDCAPTRPEAWAVPVWIDPVPSAKAHAKDSVWLVPGSVSTGTRNFRSKDRPPFGRFGKVKDGHGVVEPAAFAVSET